MTLTIGVTSGLREWVYEHRTGPGIDRYIGNRVWPIEELDERHNSHSPNGGGRGGLVRGIRKEWIDRYTHR